MDNHLSGIILPGGRYDQKKSEHIRLQNSVFDIMMNQKIPVPVLGVSLGFQRFLERILGLTHRGELLTDTDTLTREDAKGRRKNKISGNLKLDLLKLGNDPTVASFTNQSERFDVSNIFKNLPQNLKNTKSAHHAHRWYFDYKNFTQKHSKHFNILSTSTHPLNGQKFINTISSKKYPFIGTSWHPEKPAFEFNELNFERRYHTGEAIKMSQYFGNVFVDLTREHPNRFRLSWNFLSDRLERNGKCKFYGEVTYS